VADRRTHNPEVAGSSPAPATKQKTTPLTPAQETFCQQVVLNGGDQSAAYRIAYPNSLKWKGNSIHVKASQLNATDKVQIRIKELQAKVAELAEKKFEIDADYVLRRHHEIDTMDAADILDDDGDVLPIRQWPKVWRQSISGIEISELKAGKGDQDTLISVLKKIKWPDKIRNLELLGKHVSVNAYREQVGISDPKGRPLQSPTWELVPVAASPRESQG
tara:strand:- start:570 stop:1226 length:657 start_codon:yes stop_codon:yes gene_type:complete